MVFIIDVGVRGPAIFMVDDSRAEQAAIRGAYPESVHLLCLFHVLQAAWRWTWDGKHGIAPDERKGCYYQFSKMVYCTSEADLNKL